MCGCFSYYCSFFSISSSIFNLTKETKTLFACSECFNDTLFNLLIIFQSNYLELFIVLRLFSLVSFMIAMTAMKASGREALIFELIHSYSTLLFDLDLISSKEK